MLGIELLSWYNAMLVDFTLTHTSVWDTFHWELSFNGECNNAAAGALLTVAT